MLDDPVLVNDWHPVAWSGTIGSGDVVGTRLLGEDIVVWRSDSELMAWRDLCVHRGTRLSLGAVENGRLVCAYHGWNYDQSGACVLIPAHPERKPPARAQVQTYRVVERYGLVWVSLGEPPDDVPPLPEEDTEGFRLVLSGPWENLKVSGTRLIENFLDISHLPFVHSGTLGDPRRPEIRDYTVGVGPGGIAAEDIVLYQPDPFGTGGGEDVSYTYKVFRPFTAYLSKTNAAGATLSIFFPITPHDVLDSTGWFIVAISENDDSTDQQIVDFTHAVMAEDIPIVGSQRPELLPLDLQAELHLKSDRVAVAYRRWVNDLGLTFGTA